MAALSAKCVEEYSNADCDHTKEIKYREKHGDILEQFHCILQCPSEFGEYGLLPYEAILSEESRAVLLQPARDH